MCVFHARFRRRHCFAVATEMDGADLFDVNPFQDIHLSNEC